MQPVQLISYMPGAGSPSHMWSCGALCCIVATAMQVVDHISRTTTVSYHTIRISSQLQFIMPSLVFNLVIIPLSHCSVGSQIEEHSYSYSCSKSPHSKIYISIFNTVYQLLEVIYLIQRIASPYINQEVQILRDIDLSSQVLKETKTCRSTCF